MPKGRPRKIRPVSLPKVQRLAAEQPRKAVTAQAAVDDPYEPGAQITVLRNLIDDPLAWLHTRRQIDDAQLRAGRAWQKDFEIAERGLLPTVDLERVRVDGGIRSDPFTDYQRAAALRLAGDRALLGEMAHAVMCDVVGKGMGIDEAAAARGQRDERSKYFYGRVLREALEVVARARGYGV
jgi:hypothetical protein